MKLDNGVPRGSGESRVDAKKGVGQKSLTPLPVAWMDPMSWRLPSGKALAEFALQSGFLAPLMLGTSMGDGRIRRRPAKGAVAKKTAEVPVSTGSFRSAAVQRAGRGFGAGEQR